MAIEREVIEAYFESNGFLVRQAGDVGTESLKKKLPPLPTIAVFNPMISTNTKNLNFRVFTGDLSSIRCALVSILGWEDTSFSIDCIGNEARLLKFFRTEAVNDRLSLGFKPNPMLAESGMGEFLKLLVIPSFPRDERKIGIVVELLKQAGVDGVLTIGSILENLLRQTAPSMSFLNQNVFQLLKLLKAYDLVKQPQLDMFD